MIISNIQSSEDFENLPSNWKVLKFGEVLQDTSSGNAKYLQSEYLQNGTIPVVDQGKDLIAGYLDGDVAPYKGNLPVIVFGDHTRHIKFIDFPFAIGADGVKVLTPKIEVNPKYLYFFLLKLELPNAGYSRHFKFLKEISIPLPPLEEQKRIAEVLDKADRLRQKDRQLLAKYDQLLQSVFLDMFGDPVKNEKGWEVKMLKEVVHQDKIITYGIVQAGPHVDEGVPYIKTGDIKKGKINTIGLSRTSLAIAKDYKRSEVQEGDIVMSIRATVGTLALVPYELNGANLTQGTARISSGPSINNYYLFNYLLSESVQRWIQNQVKGATFREITLGRLRELPVVIPPKDFQSKFERIFVTIEKQKELVQESISKTDLLFQSLLQKAFKGELSLKATEPAAALDLG